MSSTELAVVDAAELEQLAALAGADPSANRGPRVPQLKINMDDEDADGKPLPRGYLFLTDQDEPVYAKTVRIRPLLQHFQYSEYDSESNKTVCRTIEATSFNEEFYDTRGTVRCGRPGGKAWKDAPEEVKKRYEDVTAFRLLRCLVSYEGETKSGEKRVVENVPAILRLKGASFMPFEDEVVKQLPSGRKIWDFNCDIELERQKNGAVVYYIVHFKPDLNNPLPMDIPTFDTIKHFVSMVEGGNRKVLDDYKSALSKRAGDDAAYDSIGGAGGLEGDFEDAA